MSRHPELYQWVDTVVMRFPSLSKPQALGLALWSFGMVLARSCSLTAVADVLATLDAADPTTRWARRLIARGEIVRKLLPSELANYYQSAGVETG